MAKYLVTVNEQRTEHKMGKIEMTTIPVSFVLSCKDELPTVNEINQAKSRGAILFMQKLAD